MRAEHVETKWKAPFFTIWTGQAVSLLGSQLVQFSLVWWLTQQTGSGTILATATLAAMLPQVFLMPVAGVLVDRWNRRRTMIAADGLIAAATVVLAMLFLTGQVQIWHIYALMFLRSAAGGFHWTAMQTSTSLMVPTDQLSRVQGLNQMLHGGMNIFSAPLAALLLAALPIQGILAIDVTTAFVAIVSLLFVHIPQPVSSHIGLAGESKPTLGQDLLAGLRYVAGWPGLLLIGLMAAAINFVLTPAGALTPLLVTKHFGGEALQLAWLESASGIGVILGGLLLGIWGGFKRKIHTVLFGLLGIGAGSLVIGLVPAPLFWLAVAAMFLTGAAMSLTNGPLMAALQAVVEPGVQGRVFSLINAVATAMTPLGLILAGPIADAFGTQVWYVLGGAVTLFMGISGYFIPAVLHFEDGRGQPQPPASAGPVFAAGKIEIE